MTAGAEADGPPPDSHAEIMDATYRALCEQGYANLTMADIAEELGKSTSLLHYHYDTKRDLLAAFLEHIVEEFEGKLADLDSEDPRERLESLLDMFVFSAVEQGSTNPRSQAHEDAEEADRREFHLAILELRAQVPHEDPYREPFLRSEESVRDVIAGTIREGIEAGVFEEADPEETAALVFAAMDGARARQITLGIGDYTETVKRALSSKILADSLAEGTA